jgi:bifunctional non-homologous end joining protein LigD
MARRSTQTPQRSGLHIAAVPAPMPASLPTMQPMLVRRPFSNRDWLYELKFDGWRALCFIRDGHSRFLSRKNSSLTERFPELRNVARTIKAITAIIDGEIVALDNDGIPNFKRLQFRKHKPTAIVFYAFDLLYLDGFDLTVPPGGAKSRPQKDFTQEQYRPRPFYRSR